MEYLLERLQVLFEQEKTTYATLDYLQMASESAFDVDRPKVPSEKSDDEIDSFDTRLYTDSSCPPGSRKRKLRQENHSEVYHALENKDDIHRRMSWREKLCEWAYRGK